MVSKFNIGKIGINGGSFIAINIIRVSRRLKKDASIVQIPDTPGNNDAWDFRIIEIGWEVDGQLIGLKGSLNTVDYGIGAKPDTALAQAFVLEEMVKTNGEIVINFRGKTPEQTTNGEETATTYTGKLVDFSWTEMAKYEGDDTTVPPATETRLKVKLIIRQAKEVT